MLQSVIQQTDWLYGRKAIAMLKWEFSDMNAGLPAMYTSQ